ncbi:general transcription factor IIH subunit 3-like [Dreissena polymorpha]|uniref:general transcription factor IIH subunit 3-like n=1 Tax=Dreissena polymorpha TaxID=45954 RepID=UPI002263C01F|nr:general transcription factor IIH subunit 3-like [Dreissena polymorpha]
MAEDDMSLPKQTLNEYRNEIPDDKLTLSKCLDSLMVFANSHLIMHHINKLAIISAHSNGNFFLYPKRSSNEHVQAVNGDESHDMKYELFERMNEDVYFVVLHNVVIDACILESDSGLLQQACDITGGMYLKIPQSAGLLQYLLWVYLPDPVSREKLNLPPRVQVDYRTACFCHRNLIDIGYVCSVCLSKMCIFCNFSPICSTCQTTFKIMAPPKLAKKKSKKAAG